MSRMVLPVVFTLLYLTSGVRGYCHWRPAPGTSFQWQLQGSIDLTVNADVFDIDLFDATDSDIITLKSNGKKVICYFSAGSHENWRSDVSGVPNSTLGSPLGSWPGERWWDIRVTSVRNVISGRLDLAVSRGCDAVEPDNVDAYQNNNGLGISECDQLDFNRWTAYEAHHRGLSIGLKNAVGLISDLESSYDWALNEECMDYTECGGYQRFLDNNKAVFHVEYVDQRSQGRRKKRQVCGSNNRPSGFTTLIKTWDLTAWRLTC